MMKLPDNEQVNILMIIRYGNDNQIYLVYVKNNAI